MTTIRAFPQELERIAIGISRVSLLKQVDNYSLESQSNKIESLNKKFGPFAIPADFMLDDGGYSGTNFDRPALRKALRMIRAGEANAVVFPYLDRFARNVEGGLAMIRQFREAGAQVLLGDYGWVSDERHFKMQMQLGLMIAEWQRDDIADNSRSGVETKIRQGKAHGGSPFGWHFVTAPEIAAECLRQGRPVPSGKPENVHRRVEADLDTVRLMGQLTLAGASQRGICRELLVRAIPSPGGRVRWNPTTVSKILRDPVYSTGIWHYGKREAVAPRTIRKPTADRHKTKSSWRMRPESEWLAQKLEGGPIWSKADHEAILEALERNGRVNNGKGAAEDGWEALLKGLLKCEAHVKESGEFCGKAMAPAQMSTPAGRRCWYRCTHRDRVTGQQLCDCASVKAQILEAAVWNGMVEALTVKLPDLVNEYRDQIGATVDTAELERLRAEEQRLVAKKNEARDKELYADDDDDKRYYAARLAEFKGQLALLRRRIASFTAEAAWIEVDTAAIAEEVRAAMRTQVRSERRELLVGWIHEVHYAYGEATITLRVPLKPVVKCQHDQHAAGARDSAREGNGRAGVARRHQVEVHSAVSVRELQDCLRTRAAVQIEVLALRHQLNVLRRSVKRAKLTAADRFLWARLSRFWTGWRSALVIVKPETVIDRHRKGFRVFWTWKVRRG
jgi:DNA invertase Pin-like site-specific DNA recombinase